jgi:hypothetical protein
MLGVETGRRLFIRAPYSEHCYLTVDTYDLADFVFHPQRGSSELRSCDRRPPVRGRVPVRHWPVDLYERKH